MCQPFIVLLHALGYKCWDSWDDIKTEMRMHLNVDKAFSAVHLSQEGWDERGLPRAHSSHYGNQPARLDIHGQTKKYT